MMGEEHLLVIDDNPDIADLVCAAAERLQRPCTAVSDVAAFLTGLALQPTVVMMDLRMPGMSGEELLTMLAARGCRAKIILMSGVGKAALEIAGRQAEAKGLTLAGLLVKPFRIAELLALLEG